MPRQYSLDLAGAGAMNLTRNATASDNARFEIFPGDMVSDNPLRAEPESLGMPHKGPWIRGKRTNNTSVSGAASAKINAPNPSRCFKGGTTPVYWNDSCALK